MKTIILIFSSLVLIGCGKGGAGDNSTAGAELSSKPLFSLWTDNGGVTRDFSALRYGLTTLSVAVRQGVVIIQCDSDVTVVGSENQGQVQITRSIQTTTGYYSTACADLLGTYEYFRSQAGMVIGRQGQRPIEYH